eukprot:621349-Pyramimonas_sp.AAC.2
MDPHPQVAAAIAEGVVPVPDECSALRPSGACLHAKGPLGQQLLCGMDLALVNLVHPTLDRELCAALRVPAVEEVRH